MIDLIKADWPAPDQVHAYSTTRIGGYSLPPYDTLNLAMHVGDDPVTVDANRKLLIETLDLPTSMIWLEQIHGTRVISIDTIPDDIFCDGSYAREPNTVCAVLTADCLPLLITNPKGTIVAAIHAGWRGLAAGIIDNAIAHLRNFDNDFMVWLGPAIGPEVFEVGNEVRTAFVDKDRATESAFLPSENGRWLANIFELARINLRKLDINDVYGGQYCTYSDPERFYSYRRDGQKTGRMASLIWLTPYF